MKRLFFVVLAAFTLARISVEAADAVADDPLAAFKPFLGTWKGHFKNSTPENPLIDVAHWERTLNGKAIRVLHSINDGMYGGETLMMWDAAKGQIVYSYFTTAGFRTTGTAKVENSKVICHEVVSGSAEGVAEVKATVEMRPNGTFSTKSEYLKGGAWVPGHEVSYERAPEAKVVFK